MEAGVVRVLRGWDHGGFTGGGERLANAVVSIVGLVGDELIGGHLR